MGLVQQWDVSGTGVSEEQQKGVHQEKNPMEVGTLERGTVILIWGMPGLKMILR